MDSLPTLPPLLGSKCPAFEAFPSKFEPFLPGGSTLLAWQHLTNASKSNLTCWPPFTLPPQAFIKVKMSTGGQHEFTNFQRQTTWEGISVKACKHCLPNRDWNCTQEAFNATRLVYCYITKYCPQHEKEPRLRRVNLWSALQADCPELKTLPWRQNCFLPVFFADDTKFTG